MTIPNPEIRKHGSGHIHKKTPERQPEEAISQSDMSNHTSRNEDVDTQPVQYGFSQEAETALGWLRDRIDFPMTMFGAAYLGYVGGLFDEGFAAGFPAWLWETNEAMLLEYPFIAEIDEEHIIGGAGHLYCIVPVDENATVAINRVQWNEATQTDEVTEVLYRSESGEPELLFANLDGVAYEADTQVFITDNSGNTCEWYPSLDAMSYLAPCISEAGDYSAACCSPFSKIYAATVSLDGMLLSIFSLSESRTASTSARNTQTATVVMIRLFIIRHQSCSFHIRCLHGNSLSCVATFSSLPEIILRLYIK